MFFAIGFAFGLLFGVAFTVIAVAWRLGALWDGNSFKKETRHEGL